MHCDLMQINFIRFLVSITQPLGFVIAAHIENATTPTLHAAIRRMFGIFGSRWVDIIRFTSDNDKGLTALFEDMNAISVKTVTVRSGQHDHIIERMIRWLKEIIRSILHSVPYYLTDSLLIHMALSSPMKLNTFPSKTWTDNISPFECLFGEKIDLKRDIGPPFSSYCQVTNRLMTSGMQPRTLDCIYFLPRFNGSGTQSFMRLDNQIVISANHFETLPVTPDVIAYINLWATKNKLHMSMDSTFMLQDQIVDDNDSDDNDEEDDENAPRLVHLSAPPLQSPFGPPVSDNR